ncbi:ferredoxin [Bradyrhizobium sacchari]|uniref:2Fe-2S ferredoxin n=1 Tax=Bradyrhizobium sacchari TaxID=1399419 RepID=A0A560JL56_9BRAD|nr:2Fe-2S iron-sulfur cluster-binding protein [Bradyrhizobium sacchari]OPY98522.1 ferredoxin [Bradyrhizobium sacchari]TWB57012.1 2Fe-2S ferredoxin [Bradyrhizobium sacchari]TWB71289.1 2Fe-2S ferredoxin [Bradyrhizobium sacchari]
MTTLTVMPEGKTIEVTEGTTLLAALLGAEIAILHKCEGQAKCGSCHIFVQEGRKGLSKIAKLENEKLDSIVGVGSKSRLACQATVLGTEDVKIELLGFSSGL